MNDNFEINDWVKITMKNKSVICGQVTALGKKLVDGEEHDFYQVRVLDDRETTVSVSYTHLICVIERG